MKKKSEPLFLVAPGPLHLYIRPWCQVPLFVDGKSSNSFDLSNNFATLPGTGPSRPVNYASISWNIMRRQPGMVLIGKRATHSSPSAAYCGRNRPATPDAQGVSYSGWGMRIASPLRVSATSLLSLLVLLPCRSVTWEKGQTEKIAVVGRRRLSAVQGYGTVLRPSGADLYRILQSDLATLGYSSSTSTSATAKLKPLFLGRFIRYFE